MSLPAAKVITDPAYRECFVSDSVITGRPKDGLYEPALADSEREAVADLLQYLENVRDFGIPGDVV